MIGATKLRSLPWSRAAHERALHNARTASTELSRARVEREEVEIFLAQRYAAPSPGSRPA